MLISKSILTPFDNKYDWEWLVGFCEILVRNYAPGAAAPGTAAPGAAAPRAWII